MVGKRKIALVVNVYFNSLSITSFQNKLLFGCGTVQLSVVSHRFASKSFKLILANTEREE